MLILPNVFMVYTEPTPLLTRVVNVLLPLGAYWLCMSWFRKPGWAFWALFLFIFFDQCFKCFCTMFKFIFAHEIKYFSNCCARQI